MVWPNPFRKYDENTRTAWGYTFQLTPDHMSPEQMDPLKHSYDVLGEECLNILDALSPPLHSSAKTAENEEGKEAAPKRDLYALLRDNASTEPKLKEMWDEVNTIPDWVDWDQISRGQEVFYRYGGVALTALAFQSLLGGMGAGRVVETLSRTGGFSAKVARGRMFETTQHILQVTSSLDSIKPGGDGFASSIRVRLLHAAVRRRLMALATSRPSFYSVSEYGVPINDLDCVATIGSFSASLIWLGFPRQGIFLREREIADYTALWRLVAHYLGTPTEFFETPDTAKRIMESLIIYEVNPTETSKKLANNIIVSLADMPPAFASREFLEANARWLNGNDLCDALGLGRPSFYYWILVAGQCLFFMGLCYTYRSIDWLDKRKIKTLRQLFYKVIIENETHGLGKETNFEFKYIPEFYTRTDKGSSESPLMKPTGAGVERRNLTAFVIASVAIGVGSWLGLNVVRGVGGRLLNSLVGVGFANRW